MPQLFGTYPVGTKVEYDGGIYYVAEAKGGGWHVLRRGVVGSPAKNDKGKPLCARTSALRKVASPGRVSPPVRARSSPKRPSPVVVRPPSPVRARSSPKRPSPMRARTPSPPPYDEGDPDRGDCVKSYLAKYVGRPGPPYPAQKCRDMYKLGNDKKMYKSVPDKNGVYKWVKRERER